MTTTETVKLAVKPLEWTDRPSPAGAWATTDCMLGRYIVETIGGKVNALGPPGFVSYGHVTIEAAKAAAQADYEKRILSAIAIGGEVEPVAARLATWFNSLPGGGMGKEHFDALLAIVATPNPAPSVALATEIRDLLHDLHSIIVVAKGEWTKQSAWSDWDQSVYERLLSAQAGLATTPNPAPSGEAVPVAPEGWVLVPREPTQAMLDAFIAEASSQGVAFDDFSPPQYPAPIYRAMLAAAPPSPQGVDLLAEMAKRPGWSIERGHKDPGDEEFSPYGWCVHEVRGNRSDREWALIGFGDTPADALTAALSPTGGTADPAFLPDPSAVQRSRPSGNTPDLVARLRAHEGIGAAMAPTYATGRYITALMDEAADRLESISTVERQSDELLAAQNGIVRQVWGLLGGEDPTREGGQNLIVRVREKVEALTASQAEVARLTEALKQARRTMRNCAGAIQSGQIVDKEVDRNLRRGYEAIDAVLNGRAALTEQKQ